MIDDVDATLEALIRTAVPSSSCLVDFQPPSRDWSDGLSRPCVNLFLHELVEERAARGADWVDERDERGRVTVRRPPLRTFRLSYLVSAWQPTGGKGRSDANAHTLLGQVLRVFVEADPIPDLALRGTMIDESGLVELWVAEPYEHRARPHELWASLGVPSRSSFDLVVKAPLRTSVTIEAAAAVEAITLSAVGTRSAGGQDAVRRPGAMQPEKRWTSFRIREENPEAGAAD